LFLTRLQFQAAIDTSPASLKKKKEEEAAAAVLKKKKEEEAAAAVLQKKKEEEAAAAVLKKKEEEAAAAALKKKEEDWRRLVNENREDIDDIKSVLSQIGLSKGKSQKYAEALVLTHKVNSVSKFQRKVGSDIAGYSATLQLDTDDVELLEEYFRQNT
jgi:membrane protein involved in colicin uptake